MEAAWLGTEVPAEAIPMPSRPKAALQDIERGERSRTIRQVVLFR